ncbi:MAG: hypothetical protein R3E32_17920 [Chitinophagales bacterium]
MKKILSILSVFAILFSTNIFAQDQASSTEKVFLPGKVKVYNAADFQINPEQVAQELTNIMTTQLSLNEQQKQTIYQINLETAQERLTFNNLQDNDTNAFISAVMGVYQNRNASIESVLTTKQKLDFKQMKESMMSRKVDAQ